MTHSAPRLTAQLRGVVFRGGAALLLALVLAPGSGCVVVTPDPPAPVTIELVNPTAANVRPNLFTSSSAGDEAGLFVAANLNTSFTTRPVAELRAGESATITLDCAQLRTIGVDRPVLFNGATLSVTTSDDRLFLAKPGSFDCGSRVRFVFFTEGNVFRARVELP